MGDSGKGRGSSLISLDVGASRPKYRVMRSKTESGDYYYAVYMVEFDAIGRPIIWSKSPEYPSGLDKNSIMEDWRMFNQAIHSDVLDHTTGDVVEAPFVSPHGMARK